MSTCAVMLVKDEADVIEYTLRHLAYHVDEMIVADNRSSDGTREILRELALELPLHVDRDPDLAHYQGRKTTALAMRALDLGHSWVVPCDADELWYVAGEIDRPIRDYLAGQTPDVQFAEAELYHHLPSAEDAPTPDPDPLNEAYALGAPDEVIAEGIAREQDEEPNPYLRIGYRNIHKGGLPKLACRLRPDLTIHEGNHGATTTGTGLRVGGLCVRHFSWRSEEQYVRKIANGARAFAAADPPFPEDVGKHWRDKGSPDDPDFEERVGSIFRTYFYSRHPEQDRDLIYDPAPYRG